MQELKSKSNQEKSFGNLYVPSSLEKKRVVLMYLFFGIIIFVTKREMSVFEYFHLRQSLWWSVLFVLFVMLSIVFLFLPILKYLWFLLLLAFVTIWILFVLDSWKWKYQIIWWEKSPLSLFRWIGEWILNLFEINIKIYPTQKDDLAEISSLEDLIK